MIKTKNISEMLTSLIEEYRFNKNTLSKYLEITEETIDGVVMGNVECLPDDPALRLKILSKAGKAGASGDNPHKENEISVQHEPE